MTIFWLGALGTVMLSIFSFSAVQNERSVYTRLYSSTSQPNCLSLSNGSQSSNSASHIPCPYTMVIAPSLMARHPSAGVNPPKSGKTTDFTIRRLTEPEAMNGLECSSPSRTNNNRLTFLAAVLMCTTKLAPIAQLDEEDRRLLLGQSWHLLFVFHYACQFGDLVEKGLPEF
jgi:hypothetical protein